MLVRVIEDCFINNRLYRAGEEFDYNGPTPKKGVGPLVVLGGSNDVGPSEPPQTLRAFTASRADKREVLVDDGSDLLQ